MSQNLVDLSFTPDTIAQIETALGQLEAALQNLVALTPDQRRELPKMGDKSETFCRMTLAVVRENPGIVARDFPLDGFGRDMQCLDTLRPFSVRLARLYQRVSDTETALGSDLMTASLEAYAFLKVAGKGKGLDEARRTLSARFARKRGTEPEAAPAA